MIGKLNIFKNKSLNTFLRYSLKYKWVMTAVVFTSAVSSAMGAVPAWLSKYLIDDVLVNKNAKMMALVIGGIFVSTILKVVTGYFSSISSNYVTETIKRDIKIDVYSHLQKLPMSYFKRNKLGDVMARLSGDSATLGRIGFIILICLKNFLQ